MNFLSFDISEINDNGIGITNYSNNNIYNDYNKHGGVKKKTIKKITTQKKKTNKTTKKVDNKVDNKDKIKIDSESSEEEETLANKIVDNIDLTKKQEEFKVSEILKEPIIELTNEELKLKIDEYFNNYSKFVDIIHEYYTNIRVPLYIKEETNIEIKLLHILNELRKISSLLNSPLILTDYHKTNEIKTRNRELFSRKPILDKSTYVQTITNLSLLDINEIKKLVNKYNYSDLFRIMKFKFSKAIFIVEPDDKLFCKRYWINNMEQYKNLVYDKSVYYKTINKNTGINPVYIELTDTILYKNEEKIQSDLKRFISNEKTNIDTTKIQNNISNINQTNINIIDVNKINNNIKISQSNISKIQEDESCFVNAYNKYIENKINTKMVKCTTVSVRTMINITDQLINSININNLMNNSTQNSDLIDRVLSDVRIFLVDVLYNMNSSIKNKRELYFANAKIIFDITKNIKSNLKTELYSQDIKFPIDTFEKKTEIGGRLKNIIIKVINESGVKTIGRSVDQTICI